MLRRASRSYQGTATSFVYDGQDVVADKVGTSVTTDYLNGAGIDDKLRQSAVSTGNLYFLQDHLGSTNALTSAGGGVVERQSYEAFGASNGSSLTRYGYTGRERDEVTGLMYYRARWYDRVQGRFATEDPAGLEASPNRYAYVGSNPLNSTDPSGLDGIGVYRDRPGEKERRERSGIRPTPTPRPTPSPTPTPTPQPTPSTGSSSGGGSVGPRLPDFASLNFAVPIPNPYTLGFVGISGNATVDRYGNFYFGLGPGAGFPGNVGINVNAGWKNQLSMPTPDELSGVLSGHGVSLGGYYGPGVTVSGWPGSGSTTQVGLGTPGVGVAYNYTWKNPYGIKSQCPPW